MIENFDNFRAKILSVVMIALPAGKLFAYILYLLKVIDDPFIIQHVSILWMMIPVLLGVYIYGLCKNNDSFNYLDIIMILLIFFALLSTIFSIRINISLWGESRRNEGLLSLVNYYLMFLNAKNIKDADAKKKLINIFLYLGLFQVLYSIIQIYTDWGIVKRHSISYLAPGLCGNPNFLASYMSMLVILSATLYIKNSDKGYLLLAMIYDVSLVLAETSGPFLAVAITLIFMMFYFHKKKYIKRIIIVCLSLIAIFVVTNASSMYVQEEIFGQKVSTEYNIRKELLDTSKKVINSNIDSNTVGSLGNNRVKMWLTLLPKVKDYWLVGSGLDTIAYIYPQNGITLVNKAHNVYLQILLTNGLPALVTYCTLCMIVFIKGFKLDNDDISLYMLFVVYSIQAFANISVIDVAPYFFLFFGLVASNFNYKCFFKNKI